MYRLKCDILVQAYWGILCKDFMGAFFCVITKQQQHFFFLVYYNVLVGAQFESTHLYKNRSKEVRGRWGKLSREAS